MTDNECKNILDDDGFYTTPQDAPWPVGTRVKYIGNSKSRNAASEVWTHYPGAMYTVVKVNNYKGWDTDPETGERYPYHAWSTLRSDDDPAGAHEKAIGADNTKNWKVVREAGDAS